MKKLWVLFSLILFFTACAKPKVMIALAGQSNAVFIRDTLAYNYKKITGREAYIIQCAKAGSALNAKAETNDWGNWSPTGDLLEKSFDEIDKRFSLIYPPYNIEENLSAIIWSQGENDGEAIGKGILTAEEYKRDLKNLISKFRERYGANLPFIIIEIGRHATCKECDEGYSAVRKVQDEVAEDDKNTYIGYDETKDFLERKWLRDPVHCNQEALNDIAKKLVKFMVANNID